MEKVEQAARLYHRLLLIVGPAGTGKTTTLREVRDRTRAPLVNVNLEISRRMLDMNRCQRTLSVPRLLQEITDSGRKETILLDNLEVLFDVQLNQNPLRLLQRLSRNKTVVAAWNGSIINGSLIYAVTRHPEYRRYRIHDLLVVNLEEKA